MKIVKLRFLNCQKKVEFKFLYMANYNSLLEDCQTKKSNLLEKSWIRVMLYIANHKKIVVLKIELKIFNLQKGVKLKFYIYCK